MTPVEKRIAHAPADLDPIGWRAAVMAVEEYAVANNLRERMADFVCAASFYCIGERLSERASGEYTYLPYTTDEGRVIDVAFNAYGRVIGAKQ